jgi:hypothetical protein
MELILNKAMNGDKKKGDMKDSLQKIVLFWPDHARICRCHIGEVGKGSCVDQDRRPLLLLLWLLFHLV